MSEKRQERRLGRGLESLLGTTVSDEVAATDSGRSPVAQRVPVSSVHANPFQPRTGFPEREMSDLVDSVRRVGVLQPLLVRPSGDGYELIAGERRLRAAKAAGLSEVPVIVRKTSDDEMLTLALVENLQREDLNPIEKAQSFKHLIEQFHLTQEEASHRLGKDRSTLANFMRLLDLPESVQHIVSRGTITMGHARALLGLKHASAQQALALRIENEGISVRETERLVAQSRGTPATQRKSPRTAKDPFLRDIEDRLRERLGTRVSVDYKGGKGRLVVSFFSDDDLQRVLDVLGVNEER